MLQVSGAEYKAYTQNIAFILIFGPKRQEETTDWK
jgi:hypothetical protein